MNALALTDQLKEVALITFIVLASLAALTFPFRKRHAGFVAMWASLQSWLIAAPLIFLLLILNDPARAIGFCVLAVLGLREFFQMTGIYHRSSFVWATYIGIYLLGWTTLQQHHRLYDFMPMIFMAAISGIPILKNEAKHMIQYKALSMMGYVFLGWGFLYSLWVLKLPNGIPIFLFIVLVSEFADQVNLVFSRVFGTHKIASNITPLRTYEGVFFGTIAALTIGYSARKLLPVDDVTFWLPMTLTAASVGAFGDLIFSVIRRDIGVRDVGAFIIGRGGFLDRMDRLIFVFPSCYYLLQYLTETFHA
ncbi:MAG: phosphatidate cytidylyltransferase [Bdellovibrionales bacterium]|nr:phosphatidate cytidylyltransferase [Bdellovibrionales bacterium]